MSHRTQKLKKQAGVDASVPAAWHSFLPRKGGCPIAIHTRLYAMTRRSVTRRSGVVFRSLNKSSQDGNDCYRLLGGGRFARSTRQLNFDFSIFLFATSDAGKNARCVA